MQHAVFETKSPIKPQEKYHTSSSRSYLNIDSHICTHMRVSGGAGTVATLLQQSCRAASSRKYALDMIMIGCTLSAIWYFAIDL